MTMSRCCQSRSCQGGVCEKRPRTPLCQSQHQPAPKWTHHRTQLGQSATLVAPLGKQFRKDKKSAQQLRGVRKIWQKQHCRQQVQWRRRGGGVPGTRADSLVAHGEDCAGCLARAHGRPLWSRWVYPEGSCSLWRIHTRELCSLWRGAHSGAVSWQDLWPMGDLCWNSLSLKVCIPWKGHTLNSWRAAAHGKDPPWRSTGASTLQQGKSVRTKEFIMNWWQLPFLVLLCLLEERGRRTESEVDPRKKRRGGMRSCFKDLSFISHYHAIGFDWQ